jgi:hypothetical protein
LHILDCCLDKKNEFTCVELFLKYLDFDL